MGRHLYRGHALKKSRYLLTVLVIMYVFTYPSLHAEAPAGQDGDVCYTAPDIDGADRDEVEQFRKRYLKTHEQKWLYEILDSGEPYRHYIRKRLKEGMIKQ